MSKVDDALDIIKGMTLIELRDLNKAIEEEFGVTAAAPVAMMAAPAAGGGDRCDRRRRQRRRRAGARAGVGFDRAVLQV